MWLTKTLSENFREARYSTHRRVLRLRVKVPSEFEHLEPKKNALRNPLIGNLDQYWQFDNVDLRIFHGFPVGESNASYWHDKLRGHFTFRTITAEQYQNDENEND